VRGVFLHSRSALRNHDSEDRKRAFSGEFLDICWSFSRSNDLSCAVKTVFCACLTFRHFGSSFVAEWISLHDGSHRSVFL